MPPLRAAALQLRTARRVVQGRGLSLRGALGPLDERMVFVVGSPRSGTTFLARAIGSCPGFVDLGEVAALKAAIPELHHAPPEAAAGRIRRMLAVTRRLSLAGGVRAVEQTPESAFVAPAIALAFPRAAIVHIVRDGRDVVCSLVERGWLSAGRGGVDDAGLAFGAYGRFWVEPRRQAEFERASDVRRAAWAWRCYVDAALRLGDRAIRVRYEDVASDPARAAERLAARLQAPGEALARELSAVYGTSVGRHRRELSAAQLAEVEDEAGGLLARLGYVGSPQDDR